MSWSATADVERFDDAVEWFANRFPITEELADELGDYAGPRAWTVAGVAQLDIVMQVHASILRALSRGTPFDEWKREISATLTAAWGAKNAHRIETIFRNATSQALSAGRWRQITDPDVMTLRPYGLFDAVLDARTSDICEEWDGTILPLDEFAQRGAVPQLHHRCRSQIRSITQREAFRRGVTDRLPDATAQTGFGKAPTEADWSPDSRDYSASLFAEYERKRAELERKAKRKKAKTSKRR